MDKLRGELQIKALSVNKAFQGRRYKTKECKIYETFILYSLPKKEMVTGKVKLTIRFFLKNHANTDADNLCKIFIDCLVKKLYIEDDRKIYRLIVEKVPCKFYNKIEFLIEKIL